MKKLWLSMKNPYIQNGIGMLKPIAQRWVEALKKMIICQVMAIINLLDLIAQTCFLVGRFVACLVESFFQLLMIYGHKMVRPIVPTWDSFVKSCHYFNMQAMFKEDKK